MAAEGNAGPCWAYGFRNVLAAIRFVPGASPTIQEQWGVKTLTRNNAGDYTITLKEKHPGFTVWVGYNDTGTTLYNFVRVKTFDVSASTVQVEHKSVAFASVASGPALSDSVAGITVIVFARGV